jgi:hypothetical protein
VARVLCGTPSTCARSRWLGTNVIFSGEGALKVSITLTASRFSSVVFACRKAQLQLVFIERIAHKQICRLPAFLTSQYLQVCAQGPSKDDPRQHKEQLPALATFLHGEYYP